MIARGEIDVQKKNYVQHTLLVKISTIRADLVILQTVIHRKVLTRKLDSKMPPLGVSY
jgi:hypothetical protein